MPKTYKKGRLTMLCINQATSLQCVQKKEIKMFFIISPIKLGRFWWSLERSFLNKFATKSCNFFHLTWITSLHYLVKLKMFIVHMLPLSCWRNKLQNLFHLNCCVWIRQIWIEWLQSVGNIANTHYWSGQTETATENGVDHVVIVATIH